MQGLGCGSGKTGDCCESAAAATALEERVALYVRGGREGGGRCARAAEAGQCAERALRCSTANVGRAAGFGCSEPKCALHCEVRIGIIEVALIELFRSKVIVN